MRLHRILGGFLKIAAFSLTLDLGNGQVIPLVGWVGSWFEPVHELPYILIRKIETNVEERSYPTSKWICAEEFATPERFEEKNERMLLDLFAYRKQLGLPHSVPLSTKVDHRNGALYSYETCIHVPSNVQIPDEPYRAGPTRTRPPTVKLRIRPSFKVFSLEFGGYATLGTFEQKLRHLSNLLTNQTLRFDESELGSRALHFNNVYSSPNNFWNRRNEVWLLADKTSKYLQ